MRKFIPSLLDLQAFEAAARYCSFTQAAAELHVTQSAISHHVAKLERLLSIKLFVRANARLLLTDGGRAYMSRIGPLLAQIENATIEMLAHGGAGGILTLACPTTFGVNWLIPRLPDFVATHRNVTLSLRPHLKPDDNWPSALDAAIRYGGGSWPGLRSHYLTGRDAVVVCHPDLLKGDARIRKPADLTAYTLLQHEGSAHAWEQWFEAMNVTHPEPRNGPRFDPFSMLIKAAAAKLGIALVPRCLTEPELRARQIAIAVNRPFETTEGYYLVCPELRADAPAIQTLKSWLDGALAGESARLAPRATRR